MNIKSDQASGLQSNFVAVPGGFQAPDLGFPVDEAALMVHANQQVAVIPQMLPQLPQQMNGYYNPEYEMRSNYAMPQMPLQHPQPMNDHYNPENGLQTNYTMPNGEVDLPYHGVMPNVGFQQPNGEAFIHLGDQANQNFVQQSNGPNFYPGPAVINIANYYYQDHGMMPNSNLQEYLIMGGMVHHPDGRMYPAAEIWQKVFDGDKKESQAAKRADRARMERNRLGDCTPPRAVRADKRRFHEQGMIQRLKQEDMFDTTQSNSMCRSLSALENLIFEAPSTLENFKHPGRKCDLAKTGSTSKKRKASSLQRNSSKALIQKYRCSKQR